MSVMLDAVRDLQRKVYELKRQVSQKGTFSTASVTAINPVRLRVDGSQVDLTGPFPSLIGAVSVGDRVEVRLDGTRLVIVGNISGNASGSNTIMIDGVRYPASGSVRVQVGSWAYSRNDLNATTLQIPLPFAPPAGWTVETFTLETNGFTLCQTGSLDRANKRVNVRVTQPLSRELSALGRVGWRLVKE